jgi:hypothetical protein
MPVFLSIIFFILPPKFCQFMTYMWEKSLAFSPSFPVVDDVSLTLLMQLEVF